MLALVCFNFHPDEPAVAANNLVCVTPDCNLLD